MNKKNFEKEADDILRRFAEYEPAFDKNKIQSSSIARTMNKIAAVVRKHGKYDE